MPPGLPVGTVPMGVTPYLPPGVTPYFVAFPVSAPESGIPESQRALFARDDGWGAADGRSGEPLWIDPNVAPGTAVGLTHWQQQVQDGGAAMPWRNNRRRPGRQSQACKQRARESRQERRWRAQTTAPKRWEDETMDRWEQETSEAAQEGILSRIMDAQQRPLS